MAQALKKKTFNKRAFSSSVLFLSGVCLPFSGIMNHNLQLEPLSVERHFWMSVHNSAAILFTVFAIVHLSYNWRTLWRYVKKVKKVSMSKEALSALGLVLGIVGLFTIHAFHAG